MFGYSDTVRCFLLTVALFQCPSTVTVSGDACTATCPSQDCLMLMWQRLVSKFLAAKHTFLIVMILYLGPIKPSDSRPCS